MYVVMVEESQYLRKRVLRWVVSDFDGPKRYTLNDAVSEAQRRWNRRPALRRLPPPAHLAAITVLKHADLPELGWVDGSVEAVRGAVVVFPKAGP